MKTLLLALILLTTSVFGAAILQNPLTTNNTLTALNIVSNAAKDKITIATNNLPFKVNTANSILQDTSVGTIGIHFTSSDSDPDNAIHWFADGGGGWDVFLGSQHVFAWGSGPNPGQRTLLIPGLADAAVNSNNIFSINPSQIFPALGTSTVLPIGSVNTNGETQAWTNNSTLTVNANVFLNSFSFISNNIPVITVNTNGAGVGATAALSTLYPASDHDFVVRLIMGPTAVANMPVFTVQYGTALQTAAVPLYGVISRTNFLHNTGVACMDVDGSTIATTGFTFATGVNVVGLVSATNDIHFFIGGR